MWDGPGILAGPYYTERPDGLGPDVMIADASYPAPGEVFVWHAATTDVFAERERMRRALDWLQPAELERYDRYRHNDDREMFLLGRAMARALVGRALGVPPTSWAWSEGPHGRPEVAGPARPLSFNIAHSAGVVVCAITSDGEVGTDVEDRRRRATDPDIAQRFCAPAEIADIERCGPTAWRDQFLKYWTLKEAYLKARGLGIAVHLSDVSFTIDPAHVRVDFLNSLAGSDTNWAFDLTEYGDTHFIAVAAPMGRGVRPTFIIQPLPLDLLP